ncbi:hypothetical protein FisN_5Lh118 [Fistulifera solaris]|uniref:DNA-directed RNA polymerase I subunit RPA34 n=1 Tax=Fistulifera solaris TaxID=1519565 RepID=A0A1Z5JIZ3_FISSO|nr:hypothetical protein FisN_5Lh118 [Fistulifera solaris]|eukprot:GAX13973.1 hypothetical protein FisN_5Lh118 [Fistulifera solaris]
MSRPRDEDDVEETLDPPRFRLPDNFHSDRFELWTLRLPRDFNLADLNGARLPFNQQQQHQRSDEVVDFSSRKGHQKFTMQWGDVRESEGFRMILPRTNDGDSDDSDDDDGTFMYPVDIPFTRHATILHAIPQQSQFELAPSIENAPSLTEKNSIRHSYAPVPQKQGMKRRWTPLGGNTTVATSLPLKRKMRSIQDNDQAKQKVIKAESNDDDASHPPFIHHLSNTNRVMKEDPENLLSDGEQIKNAETDTPKSERKKMKKEDDPDAPVSDAKKSKKEKKSEKKEKKKKKKMKSES